MVFERVLQVLDRLAELNNALGEHVCHCARIRASRLGFAEIRLRVFLVIDRLKLLTEFCHDRVQLLQIRCWLRLTRIREDMLEVLWNVTRHGELPDRG